MTKTETANEPLLALFKSALGASAESCIPLKGDGSSRRLFRLSGGGRRAIGVLGPDAAENRAFLGFSRHFRSQGLPVPEIYAEDAVSGAYLEEDLGDLTLFDQLLADRSDAEVGEKTIGLYRRALEILPRFQVAAAKTLDYSLCYPRAAFDRQSMMWDLNYFKYYFLRLAQVPFSEQALEEDFERFAGFLLEARRDFFLYRDFQSRNIMVRGGEPFFIDYQGGRKGALQYDVASLLFDAKADLPSELREELLGYYLDAAGGQEKIDRAAFMRHYHGYVYIRILQALGAYGLRGFYERKAHFLQSIPYAVRNLEFLLRTAELPVGLPELTAVFRRLVGSSMLRQFGDAQLGLTVRVQSFSYREGLPSDEKGHGGGFVFDCRALPNPGRFERYAKLTGKDGEVVDFLAAEREVGEFLDRVFALVAHSVENYRSRNFTDLQVAFGCTGGRHRSVYCAERLAQRLKKLGVRVELEHRSLDR